MKVNDLQYIKGAHLYYVLSEKSRSELLKISPPSYSKVIAHHVTIVFALTEEALEKIKQDLLNDDVIVEVTGHALGHDVECFTVQINGETQRQDGGYYHITESVNPPAKPYYSNSLLEKLKGEPDLKYEHPIKIEGEFVVMR